MRHCKDFIGLPELFDLNFVEGDVFVKLLELTGGRNSFLLLL